MASPIIAALRRRDDLKESVQHTVQELAHMASIYGVVRASYQHLADQSNCSPRTAMRHIKRVEQVGIVKTTRQKRIVRRMDLPPTDRSYTDDPKHMYERVIRNEINQYRFLIPWDKSPQRSRSSTQPCDTMARSLPPQEREKNVGVREELENQKKGIRFLTPGSERWQVVHEEIARLETLLRE